MGRKKLTPGGPPKGKIIVNSNTWGTHERFARGTHKPAPVNDAFKKASSLLHQANPYASLINTAIRPFNRDIKDGTLWSRLTKHFYQFVESKTPIDYRSLVTLYRPEGDEGHQPLDKNGKAVDLDFAIHRHHRLSHTLRFNELELTRDPEKMQLQIFLKGLQIKFTNALPNIDGAHLTMIALYVDDLNEYVETRHQAAMLELNETQVYFELQIAPNTGVVLLCLKCEAYHNGALSGNMRTKGMDFVKGVALNDIPVDGVTVESAVAIGRDMAESEPAAAVDSAPEADPAIGGNASESGADSKQLSLW